MDWDKFDASHGMVHGTPFHDDGLLVLLPDRDEGPLDRSALSEEQQVALEAFVDGADAYLDALCEALEAYVAESDAADRRVLARERREAREAGKDQRQLLFGEEDEEEEEEELVDDGVRDLFDDPEDEEELDDLDEDEEDEPFFTRFAFESLTLLSVGGKVLLGFSGSADWDEEHGFGVLMDGLRVEEVGTREIV